MVELQVGTRVRIVSPASGREWLAEVVSITAKRKIPRFRTNEGEERLFPPDWIKEVLPA